MKETGLRARSYLRSLSAQKYPILTRAPVTRAIRPVRSTSPEIGVQNRGSEDEEWKLAGVCSRHHLVALLEVELRAVGAQLSVSEAL